MCVACYQLSDHDLPHIYWTDTPTNYSDQTTMSIIDRSGHISHTSLSLVTLILSVHVTTLVTGKIYNQTTPVATL